ncbi:hypothetical protein PMAYCL1PPCAC_02706, partial [Pristionchus mayeri]
SVIMEVDEEESFDLVASHFDREFDLSIEREGTLGEDYLKEFGDQQNSIKAEVNEVKQTISELCEEEEDRRKWRMNTQKTHLMGGLSKRLGRRHSNAFCKFYQILAKFPELISTRKKGKGKSTTFRSLHLCEVPGHFLSAIDYFIAHFFSNLRWKWMANSLNPHYEYTKACDMFLDDQLIVDYPDRWIFGEDNSGDVTKLAETLRKSKLSFDLVTADGSTYSLDHPEDQESIVFDILIGEVECALVSLREGGSFVIKVYSSFSLPSSRLFCLLVSLFKRVVIYKPPSSKSGNTERYLICTGFSRGKGKGLSGGGLKEEMSNGVMTKQECERILASSRFFSSLQMKSMENNIDLFASPSLSSEEVNILVDRAIERVMRECQMNILRDSDISTSLFSNRESRPWKELFKDNHVERLKELEDPVKAIQFMEEKQVSWLMAEDGRMVEDAVTEVEWTREEMESFQRNSPQLLVARSGDKSILHSLFIDPELWVALRTIHPEAVIDMCRDGQPINDEVFARGINELPMDSRGFVELAVDGIPSRIDWIRLLLHFLSQLGDSSVKGVTLLLPRDESSTIPLFLSRFSLSVLSIFSILFFRLSIPHPRTSSHFIIEFDLPNYPEDIPVFLKGYLQGLLEKMRNGKECLSFVPLQFPTELYPLIVFYNNEMLQRIICEKLRNV